jgi:LysM repeat protein
VLTTTVASGDTVYAIALRYDLKPESIAWANPDIMAAPWLIQPGQALTILPVDGVYHLVQPGETATQIASRYGVDAGTLVNPWNDLAAGADPAAGQWLVIPGGQGPDLEWEPPPSSP